jgi:hypothetical protein
MISTREARGMHLHLLPSYECFINLRGINKTYFTRSSLAPRFLIFPSAFGFSQFFGKKNESGKFEVELSLNYSWGFPSPPPCFSYRLSK